MQLRACALASDWNVAHELWLWVKWGGAFCLKSEHWVSKQRGTRGALCGGTPVYLVPVPEASCVALLEPSPLCKRVAKSLRLWEDLRLGICHPVWYVRVGVTVLFMTWVNGIQPLMEYESGNCGVWGSYLWSVLLQQNKLLVWNQHSVMSVFFFLSSTEDDDMRPLGHCKETVKNLQLPGFVNDHAHTSNMVGVVSRGDENGMPIATTSFILSEALLVVPSKLVKR